MRTDGRGRLVSTWRSGKARRNWQKAIYAVMRANTIKRNRATAYRRRAFRSWARRRGMTSNRYKNRNWLSWARYKRQRYINSGYRSRTYRYYK